MAYRELHVTSSRRSGLRLPERLRHKGAAARSTRRGGGTICDGTDESWGPPRRSPIRQFFSMASPLPGCGPNTCGEFSSGARTARPAPRCRPHERARKSSSEPDLKGIIPATRPPYKPVVNGAARGSRVGSTATFYGIRTARPPAHGTTSTRDPQSFGRPSGTQKASGDTAMVTDQTTGLQLSNNCTAAHENDNFATRSVIGRRVELRVHAMVKGTSAPAPLVPDWRKRTYAWDGRCTEGLRETTGSGAGVESEFRSRPAEMLENLGCRERRRKPALQQYRRNDQARITS